MGLKRKEKKALDLFKAGLADRLPGEKVELLLFGSKARGDDRCGSDIDLMVLMKNGSVGAIDEVYRAVTDASLAASVYNISLKPVSRREFSVMKKDRTPFICNFLKDAVTV